MDPNIFEILETLASATVGTSVDISPILNKMRNEKGLLNKPGDTSRFLDSLNSITNFNQSTPIRDEPNLGFIGINLAITNIGIDALKGERDRIRQGIVDQSSIDVNSSIIATNEAIKNTNLRMLEHAEKQESIMLSQSDFTGQQVIFTERQLTLVSKQNALYRITLVLTAINIFLGLGILYATVSSNADKQAIERLNTQLSAQSKEIKQLLLLKSDTVRYVLHYPKSKSTPAKK